MSGRTKRRRTEVDVWLRELGQLSTRNFVYRIASSEDILLRLDLYKKLSEHKGCVNTISFNADGKLLVSGSDDRQIVLWDWESGKVKLSFESGHRGNVFHAKIMPFSDDCSIITCAADGQVRYAKILESGAVETLLLDRHSSQTHRLAVEPGSSRIFYSCGEDGWVKRFDLRTKCATDLFLCKVLDDSGYRQMVLLNAMAIDPRNPNMVAVGGVDQYAHLFDIRKYKQDSSSRFGQPADYFCPSHLIGDDQVGITGLAFSDQSELLVSYCDENIYLFTCDMGLGPNPSISSLVDIDIEQKVCVPQDYTGHVNSETVKGVSFFGPKCEYVVSGSDCGRIFMWRKKDGELVRVMEADKHVVNCIESHPYMPVLASSGIEHDIKIWTPKASEKATLPPHIEQVNLFYRATLNGEEEDDYLYQDEEDDEDDEDDESDTSDDDSDASASGYDDDDDGCDTDDDG